MTSRGQCPCTGRSLPRLLRPGIMAFLACREAHGYQIAQHLTGMRMFAGREPDPPGVYRALREMDDEGLVTSAWHTGPTGPARRVFALSDAGRRCLDTWLATLREYRDSVDELLAMIRAGD